MIYRFLSISFMASLALAQNCNQVNLGLDWSNGSRFNGFKWFPGSSRWQPVTSWPVNANNAAYFNEFTADGTMYNFTPIDPSSRWLAMEGYIPFVELHVVDSSQPKVNVYCGGWSAEPCYGHDSAKTPMPIPSYPRIQAKCGFPGTYCNYSVGHDSHVIVLDRSNCVYYELYGTVITENGKLHAASISIFDALGGDVQRPFGWTSGSQSGLPWWSVAIRSEEIANGLIEHALGIIGFGGGGNNTPFADTAVASHTGATGDGSAGSPIHYLPYGTRIRLKSSFNISSYNPQSQVILQALKTYGGFVLDGGILTLLYEGSNLWDYPGTRDLSENAVFTLANFDVLQSEGFVAQGTYDIGHPVAPKTWPTGAPPSFTSFTANSSSTSISITKGQSVTLAWTATGVTPAVSNIAMVDYVGVVRGAASGSVVTTPLRTTTYRVSVMNKFGEGVSSPITVTVN